MQSAVFLDRDGVLNRTSQQNGKRHPPASVAELEVLPGVVEACEALRQAGFLLVVVTNQPDVARGTQRRKTVEAINRGLAVQVPVDYIRVCYHDDRDKCSCRKPAPGLLLQAAADFQINLSTSFMIGDRCKDIEAGRRAGCKTILVDCSYDDALACLPDHQARSLAEASEWILRQPIFAVV